MIRGVFLDNKSRKGEYYYVKVKGIGGRYYKVRKRTEKSAKKAEEYYMSKYVHKRPLEKYIKR